MKYHNLGNSGLKVSQLGMGTMTFGEQTSLTQTHQQLNFAAEHGVNFIDTAEMYPVPGRAETQGLTESYVGDWLKTKKRHDFILATKVTGPSRGFHWLRGGPKAVDAPNIDQALDASLKRLGTEYVDLYQIHWPDRYVPMFGGTLYDPQKAKPKTVPIEEQLAALEAHVKAGKIRFIGLSNETPWGVMAFLRAAEKFGLSRVVSVQNAYNLLNRTVETGGLLEACRQEHVGIIAYSPLAFGHLTGKHLLARPEVSRINLFPEFGLRYKKVHVKEAVGRYVKLAEKEGISPAKLALAFTRQKSFVASTLIGATTMKQLKENFESLKVTLSPETLAEIDAIHQRYPNPAP